MSLWFCPEHGYEHSPNVCDLAIECKRYESMKLEHEKNYGPENKVSRDAITRLFPMYSAQLCDRLRIGAEQYGDTSFGKGPDQLLNEIQEELLDVSGWAFILWCRIAQLQDRLREQKDGKDK